MIRGGRGGAKTLTGLDFEKRIDLRDAFREQTKYKVEGNELFHKGSVIARFYKKNQIYSRLLKNFGLDCNLSQKLLPDEAIHILSNDTIFIIEMKFQGVSGSVDEKLQTCDFKKRQYRKLFERAGLKVKYVYILNDWFKHPRYKDVLRYVESVGCYYFFERLPFDFLGLPNSNSRKIRKFFRKPKSI